MNSDLIERLTATEYWLRQFDKKGVGDAMASITDAITALTSTSPAYYLNPLDGTTCTATDKASGSPAFERHTVALFLGPQGGAEQVPRWVAEASANPPWSWRPNTKEPPSPAIEVLREALAEIIEADAEFRASMSPSVEKDPVTLACDRARAALKSLEPK